MTKRLTLRNGSQIYHREAVRPLPHSLNHLKRTLVRKVLWENRDQTLDLIALSETGFVSLCTPCWRWGCIVVPGAPGLSNEFVIQVDPRPSEIKKEVDVRHEFMSGHATLMSPPEETDEASTGSFAWSLRYSGHLLCLGLVSLERAEL